MYRVNRQKQADTLYTDDQIRKVIDGIGLDIENEVDSDYIVFCPFHNNYRSPAGEISKTTGLFWCFSCHTSKSLVELVMHQTNRTYYEALRFVDKKAGEQDIAKQINAAMEKQEEFKQFDEILIRRLNKQALESSRAVNYFRSRFITEESIKTYMLGFSEKQDMVTIPVSSPDGVYVGFVGRSIEGKVFKNTPGLPRSKTMFNLSRAKRFDSIFVVESSFDAIRIEQAGGHAVATLGSTVSAGQTRLLTKYFNNVIVVGDNDPAGQSMVQKAIERLGSIALPARLPKSVKDIGDLKDEELKRFVATVDDPLAAML